MFDILKLPSKYYFNEDTIKSGNYIDDGSLLVYYKLMQGWFSGKDTTLSFLWGGPVEWSSKDLVSYLLKLSREYSLKIENIEVIWGAIEDEYEKTLIDTDKNILPEYEAEFLIYFQKQDEYNKQVEAGKIDKKDIHTWFEKVQKYNPKHFEGSYKWALDQLKDNSGSEFAKLFNRLKIGQATADDIEMVLIYASRTLPYVVNMEDSEQVEAQHSKELMSYVLSYLSFSIVTTEDDRQKIKDDISEYLDLFIEDKLNHGREKVRIQDTSITYPSNILNFNAHKEIFSDYLKDMLSKYGNNFRIINKFEDEFPYDDNGLAPDEMKERYRTKDFLFVHCVLAFKKLGLIRMQGISTNWDALDVKPLAYESQIEVLPSFLGNQVSDKLNFDTDKSRLYVKGNEIKIKKFGDEYHTLRIIFEDPDELSKEWFFSEIREKIDESIIDDKKYYNAIYQIGLKLKANGIDNFFIRTKQSVKIDSKYLS
ncbi:hypothetical protein A2837_01855 [Candidatus Kaiserbacteria bacterium RIFCSPHIGHO2_01_FULL_46_22]|uniref:Uncharacterized protein n=1 Tax=Candidatus Kaiserbacteria bacterium RIFCSPHIGHO2_01_FULL_46_22 TaxID=1798475 RepID=A0A1F6BYF0_9BACT|nr:MAG: hypothetical protein A2837_01855 [Candidatus Kaiserbacteria bacterium RIFCSPHIGHO2_01_FULL_46_22]